METSQVAMPGLVKPCFETRLDTGDCELRKVHVHGLMFLAWHSGLVRDVLNSQVDPASQRLQSLDGLPCNLDLFSIMLQNRLTLVPGGLERCLDHICVHCGADVSAEKYDRCCKGEID